MDFSQHWWQVYNPQIITKWRNFTLSFWTFRILLNFDSSLKITRFDWSTCPLWCSLAEIKFAVSVISQLEFSEFCGLRNGYITIIPRFGNFATITKSTWNKDPIQMSISSCFDFSTAVDMFWTSLSRHQNSRQIIWLLAAICFWVFSHNIWITVSCISYISLTLAIYDIYYMLNKDSTLFYNNIFTPWILVKWLHI